MSSLPKQYYYYSADEYLALERSADYKSEYVAGEIFAMGGASPKHVLIASNIAGELRHRLKDKPCQVYASDLRIQADAGNAYFYPDVAIICGRPEYHDGKHDTVTNPIVIIEVLSPTTRNYDRGDKFAYYRRLASLREYILIDQEPCHIEQFVRTPTGFEFSEIDDCQADLIIHSLSIAIPLAEIYAKVAMLDAE